MSKANVKWPMMVYVIVCVCVCVWSLAMQATSSCSSCDDLITRWQGMIVSSSTSHKTSLQVSAAHILYLDTVCYTLCSCNRHSDAPNLSQDLCRWSSSADLQFPRSCQCYWHDCVNTLLLPHQGKAEFNLISKLFWGAQSSLENKGQQLVIKHFSV